MPFCCAFIGFNDHVAEQSLGSIALDRVVEVFQAFAAQQIEIEKRESSIVLRAANGGQFEVTLYDEGDEVMIAADRWHSHYDDADQAAFCALWLFTPFYRVVHELKGGLLAAVWIESYEPEGWMPMDPVGYINPDHLPDWELGEGEQFFRRYIMHNVVAPPKPIQDIYPGIALSDNGLPEGFEEGISIVSDSESQGLAILNLVGTMDS